MDMKQLEKRIDLLLSAQDGLIGEILPNLRAVSIGFHEDDVTLYCFFHGDYSDDDWNEMSYVEFDTSFDYQEGVGNFECIRCDEPNPLPQKGEAFAFARKESLPYFDTTRTFHPIPYFRSHKTNRSFLTRRRHIFLSIQYALLCNVNANVRWVSLVWTEATITVYFIVHGEITRQNLEAMDRVKKEMCQDFPQDTLNIKGIRCDYPLDRPFKESTTVYKRLEVDCEHFNEKASLLVSLQKALLGHIISDLLAVSVECENYDGKLKRYVFTLNFFFQKEPSEKDREEMSSLAQRILASPWEGTMNLVSLQDSEFLPHPQCGELYAYMRKGVTLDLVGRNKNFLIPYIRSHKHTFNFPLPSRKPLLLLSIQYALLGVVDKNVRSVRLTWTENAISVFFIFHGHISKSDLESMESVKKEMSQDFPQDAITVEGIRCDYPKRWTDKDTEVVYERKEVADD